MSDLSPDKISIISLSVGILNVPIKGQRLAVYKKIKCPIYTVSTRNVFLI